MTIPRSDNGIERLGWREAAITKPRRQKGLSGKGNLIGAEIFGRRMHPA